MRLNALPTSNVGVLPGVLESLEVNLKQMAEAPSEATTRQHINAWAVASVGTFVLAALDEVAHAALIGIKVIPVALNVTIGKVTGLSKYVTSPALTGEDFVGHIHAIRRRLAIQMAAVQVFFGLASPDLVTTVGRHISLFPVVGEAPEKAVRVAKQGAEERPAAAPVATTTVSSTETPVDSTQTPATAGV